ncbi:MAG: archaeosortase/exosortase family protein [Deltaproteobacteria bacterium]|nr:archaeosortase/exosortase family protein [Deltaproteobacteria bacterium]
MPTEKPDAFSRRYWIPKYILLFLLIFSVLYYLFVTNFDSLLPYFALLTHAVYAVMSVFYQGFSWEGNILRHPGFAFEITRGCDGLTSLILLVAAIIPFPVSIGRKILGLAIGIPVILGFNYLRILILALTKLNFPDSFQTMHVQILQPAMVIVTFAVFVAWLLIYVRQPK